MGRQNLYSWFTGSSTPLVWKPRARLFEKKHLTEQNWWNTNVNTYTSSSFQSVLLCSGSQRESVFWQMGHIEPKEIGRAKKLCQNRVLLSPACPWNCLIYRMMRSTNKEHNCLQASCWTAIHHRRVTSFQISHLGNFVPGQCTCLLYEL